MCLRQEATMELTNRSRALACVTLACALTSLICHNVWAQQTPQVPVQRDDPATSGAGPTSGAPGQLDFEPPKGGPPTTTDASGFTTTQPKGTGQSDNAAKDTAPRDSGNESAGTTP